MRRPSRIGWFEPSRPGNPPPVILEVLRKEPNGGQVSPQFAFLQFGLNSLASLHPPFDRVLRCGNLSRLTGFMRWVSNAAIAASIFRPNFSPCPAISCHLVPGAASIATPSPRSISLRFVLLFKLIGVIDVMTAVSCTKEISQ